MTRLHLFILWNKNLSFGRVTFAGFLSTGFLIAASSPYFAVLEKTKPMSLVLLVAMS
jgi:hypothetical protein